MIQVNIVERVDHPHSGWFGSTSAFHRIQAWVRQLQVYFAGPVAAADRGLAPSADLRRELVHPPITATVVKLGWNGAARLASGWFVGASAGVKLLAQATYQSAGTWVPLRDPAVGVFTQWV